MIRALSDYYLTKEAAKEHLFIVNYSNLDMKILQEACEIIYECLKKDGVERTCF